MQSCKPGPANNEAVSDLHGFVIIVTGGNSGIGYETSFQLALKGARVYLAARSQARIAEAIGKMKGSTQKQLDLRSLDMDLSSLTSVKAAAEKFVKVESRLDILINNAGIMGTPYTVTDSCFELQWQTNHLAPFLFTRSLLPLLISTAESNPQSSVGTKVINVSSTGAFEMAPKSGLDLSNPNLDYEKGSMAPMKRYGHSKLASVIHMCGLHERYFNSKGIQAYSVHPGVVLTNLQDGNPTLLGSMLKFAVKVRVVPGTVSVQEGAKTTLFCATSEKAVSGKFYGPGGKVDERAARVCQEGLVKGLWNESERMLREAGFGGYF